jgi:hypothetical protein
MDAFVVYASCHAKKLKGDLDLGIGTLGVGKGGEG